MPELPHATVSQEEARHHTDFVHEEEHVRGQSAPQAVTSMMLVSDGLLFSEVFAALLPCIRRRGIAGMLQ